MVLGKPTEVHMCIMFLSTSPHRAIANHSVNGDETPKLLYEIRMSRSYFQSDMVESNGKNQFRQYVGQNVRNQNGYNTVPNVGNQVVQNAVWNPGVQNVRNQNGLLVVPGIANPNVNQHGNGNVIVARAKGTGNGNNGDLDEIEEVNANYGSAEVHHDTNCYDNDIFNMFTQEEQYTELLDPITEPHMIQQNNSNVIYVESSVEQSGGTVEQHPATVEETQQRITKEINALHLSSAKTITTLNEEIANLNNQLSKEKSTVSFLNEEKKRLKSDFRIREDDLLDKKIRLENKIKELDNILQARQKQQSLYNGKVLLEKHDPPAMYDSEETLQLAQESHQKMKQLNKEIKPAIYAKINHLLEVFVSQKAKSREELYFSNTSKTASVSKSISIPNEDFSDDTSPSVARKFLNEVKITIMTLQRVVKQKMTLDIHNWSSSAHQKLLKIIKDEIYPIVNQVDARVQNFKIQFLKEAAKFVRDIKSLAKEADESLAKHKALEFEIERLLI
ncbi:hypothetical protein Tco_0653658 [Tanacetum coccineum]|uniref:Uncharacterized protein n=1 Tax=Tanacetum coccineum TaxID=301880 RepID=A0ABQ4X105_9ASTR